MPKTPLSVTLDDGNLLWLKGRAAGRKKRSLSEALDEILTAARRGGAGGDAPRSVAGTIDIAAGDPALEHADAEVAAVFASSLGRPSLVRETPPPYQGPGSGKPRARRSRRG